MFSKRQVSLVLGILLIVMSPLSSSVFSGESVVYAQDEVPTLYVEIEFDWVDGRYWPLGNSVTLTVRDPVTNLIEYTDTRTVGTDQLPTYVRFDVWEDGFDLKPGHKVTLTDGITTKNHTALDIEITNVNTASNYVEGFAPSLGALMITAHDPCWENVPVTADMMTGYWKATFTCELSTVNFIHAEMQGSEEDGVSTGFFWSPPPPPALQVEINHDWVTGWNWPVDHTVILTINGEEIDSQVVFNAPWGTEVNFNSWDTGFEQDIQPGDVVTLEDPQTSVTQTHIALDIAITGVDTSANIVEGYAAPGSELIVEAHEPCSDRLTTEANENGYWTVTFDCDLSPVEHIHIEQYDSSGTNYTSFFWTPPPPPAEPTIQVELNYDWVMGFDWSLGSWVTLTIDDPETENLVDYFDEKEVVYDEGCWMTSCVRFDFWDNFDVEPEHIITLTDGETTKTHTAFDIKITEVHANTIEGFAKSGSELFVMAHEPCWEYTWVTAEDGSWTASFLCDLETVDFVHVAKNSEDGSYTSYFVGQPNAQEIGFGWSEVVVHAHDEIVLRTGWGACTPGLVKAFQKDAHIDISINGEALFPEGDEALYRSAIEPIEIEGCMAAPSNSKASGSVWRYSLGSLEPGIYEVYVHYWLGHPMIDGGDWDGDGKMDRFEGTLVENTITILVK